MRCFVVSSSLPFSPGLLLFAWLFFRLFVCTAAAERASSPASKPLIPRTQKPLPTSSRPPEAHAHGQPPTWHGNREVHDSERNARPKSAVVSHGNAPVLQSCRNPAADVKADLFFARTRCRSLFVGPPLVVHSSEPQTWRPWTHRPVCASSNSVYCVWTHATLGGGLSIVATPDTATGMAHIVGSAAAAESAMPASKHSAALFAIRKVPGKGLGIVAQQPISRGAVILADRPRLLIEVAMASRLHRSSSQKLLHHAVQQLPSPEDVLELHRLVRADTAATQPVLLVATHEEDVLSTNAFAITANGVAFEALLPVISRINHACSPTAVTRFIEHDLNMEVTAFRDIQPGEEITISYVDWGLTRDERQTKLRGHWGFECSCDLCSGDAAATAASDARRRRVVAIRAEVVALLTRGDIAAALQTYEHELMDLVRHEHLAEHMGEHYETLARLHMAAGHRIEATHYVHQAIAEFDTFAGTAAAIASVAELKKLLRTLQT